MVFMFFITFFVLFIFLLLYRLNIGRSNLLVRCAVNARGRLACEQALRCTEQKLLKRILVLLTKQLFVPDTSTVGSVF